MIRTFDRTPLVVPVSFSWFDEKGVRHQAEGYTRDVSPYGAFVLSEELPPQGSSVRFILSLPPLRPSLPNWEMQASGHVVRVEPEGGFAAVSDKLDGVVPEDPRQQGGNGRH